MNEIEKAAVGKKCDLRLLAPSMPKEVKKTEEEKLADKKATEDRCEQYGECGNLLSSSRI